MKFKVCCRRTGLVTWSMHQRRPSPPVPNQSLIAGMWSSWSQLR